MIVEHLRWEDTCEVHFDITMNFGHGYDFDGFELMREEAATSFGRFMIWPDRISPHSRWNLYGGELGWYQQCIESREKARNEVETLVAELAAKTRNPLFDAIRGTSP